MSAPSRRPSDEELHAYLDGELAEDRRAVVAAYLHEHPADARRLEVYRADGDAIARLFARAGQHSAPQSAAQPPFWRRPVPSRAAAAVLLMAGTLAAALSWFWPDRRDDALWTRFGVEALAAHLSVSGSGPPPGMAASLGDVAEFFSATLKTPFRLHAPADPDFTLVDSRFVTGQKGRVAQLVFRNTAGVLVTMYFEPWPGKKDAPFREVASRSDVRTLVWVDDALGCAVTGALPRDALERVGHSLYAQLVRS
jgi:anti-sigma factor RsiW